VCAAKYTGRHPNLVALELSSFKCGHDAPIYSVVEEVVEHSGTPYFCFKDIDENKPTGSIRIRVETINYFLKRWPKFTLFLRKPGAPLDNNIAERALKMTIRHRKASLFYRSQRGAHVGDVFMTLIHTAELHRQNPSDYLTALQRNYKAVAEKPAD
jgi:hypothetical protein